jgi:hypothetical protein
MQIGDLSMFVYCVALHYTQQSNQNHEKTMQQGRDHAVEGVNETSRRFPVLEQEGGCASRNGAKPPKAQTGWS